MHPGNIFVSFEHPENPLWIGIDCGIVGTLNREDKRYLAENFAFFNRDYRRVAELHVESAGYRPIPRWTSSSSPSAPCWSPSSRNRSPRSPSATCCSICSTPPVASTCRVQPQLVLLQRPCSMWKGWVASLSPAGFVADRQALSGKLDARAGRPQGGVECHQEKAPFWAEKLPELPELVYETLRQARHQQHHFDQMFADFRRHSRRQGAGPLPLRGWSQPAARGVFLLAQKQHIEWGQISLAGARLYWLLGWLRTRSPLNNLRHRAPIREKVAGWYQYLAVVDHRSHRRAVVRHQEIARYRRRSGRGGQRGSRRRSPMSQPTPNPSRKMPSSRPNG